MYIWIILIGVMVASFIIQKVLQRKFDKYSDVPSPGGLSGAEVARLMLERNGIRGVEVVSIDGKLTDHYNPKDSTINLSRDVYAGRSVAACAVAAHETGHAIQHAKGYAPLKMRSAMVPVVTFANNTVQW
ncbi:MAG: zinc metallopeptidase, partial [Bacteroidales bacterium]|nr:zinc metallopeptidase [Bacteroidales bacterium]